MEANVLFDFIAENENEISLSKGETVKLINADAGNGWCEGRNSKGEEGFFPSEYIETVGKTDGECKANTDDTDDWDDWNSESSPSVSDDVASVCTKIASNDAYMTGSSNDKDQNVPESEKVYIEGGEFSGFYYWKPISQPYTVTVDSPEKLSKYAGVKSFIAYRLTPSFNGKPVSRRYKQFDWLHHRLTHKFYNIPIPPLPAKQLSGKYDCSLVEQRTVQLQKFVDWICRHPVLSSSVVWMHFLTVGEEKPWKEGKRKAEKDQFVSAHFLASVVAPEKELLSSEIVSQIDESKKYLQDLDAALKSLENVMGDISGAKHTDDYQKLSNAYSLLAKALMIDETRAKTEITLSNSVALTSGVYTHFVEMFGPRLRKILMEFVANINLFRGILHSYPKIFQEYQKAQSKRQEYTRLTNESKISHQTLMTVNRRTISSSLTLDMLLILSSNSRH